MCCVHVPTQRPTIFVYMTVGAAHTAIIFPFEWERDARDGSEKKFCPFFVKLHKHEFPFLIASLFEYIFPPLRPSLFLAAEGKHRTMGFCLVVFFTLRSFCWPFGGNIDFCSPPLQPILQTTFAFFVTVRSEGEEQEGELDAVRTFYAEFASRIPSLTLFDIFLKNFREYETRLQFSISEHSAQQEWLPDDDDTRHERRRRCGKVKEKCQRLKLFFVISFLSKHGLGWRERKILLDLFYPCFALGFFFQLLFAKKTESGCKEEENG